MNKNANCQLESKKKTTNYALNLLQHPRVKPRSFFLFAPFFPNPTNQWIAASNPGASTGGFLGESQEVNKSRVRWP